MTADFNLLKAFENALFAPENNASGTTIRQRYELAAGADEHGVYSQPHGGILVPQSGRLQFFDRVTAEGKLLSQATHLPADPKSNGTDMPSFDESSRADGSRFGGINAYWRKETTTITTSRLTFKGDHLKKHQLSAACYVTNLLWNNAPLFRAIIEPAFAKELAFKAEAAMITGDGVGKLEGVLHSPALIEVEKESGQAAATLVAANFRKMWARCWGASRENAVWLVNPDVDNQLLSIDWSTMAGVYKPAGDEFPGCATIFGRPVYPSEYCSSLGAFGDVILFDPHEYVILDSGEMVVSASDQVRMLEDETALLMVLEISGMPGWRQPVTPKNSATTVSPFVALQERS